MPIYNIYYDDEFVDGPYDDYEEAEFHYNDQLDSVLLADMDSDLLKIVEEEE